MILVAITEKLSKVNNYIIIKVILIPNGSLGPVKTKKKHFEFNIEMVNRVRKCPDLNFDALCMC